MPKKQRAKQRGTPDELSDDESSDDDVDEELLLDQRQNLFGVPGSDGSDQDEDELDDETLDALYGIDDRPRKRQCRVRELLNHGRALPFAA